MDLTTAEDRDEQLLLSHHAAASPALRYSAVHPVSMDGWLAKEGKALRARRTRYLRLNTHILSSHRSKSAPPSWQISVADAVVEKGLNPREIKISLPHRSLSLIAPTSDAFDGWIVALRRASVVSSRVDDYYTIGRLIGEGMNGQVRLATDMLTDDTVAIKMVPRLGRENETQFLAREVQIILSVNHPNIVRTIDVFVTRRRIHFVMEYLAGGELFEFIAENTHFTEIHAAAVMTDLLNALRYLHVRGIAHRDVKLENLLCANTTWPLNVKLADFGFANYVNSANEPMLSSFVGTPYYIAPEMLRADPHGRPVDIWASGVVLYILLSGKFPFGGRNESEYYQRVLSKEAYFPAEEWSNVSEEAKDLVRGMLCKDPDKRLTADQCLRHSWLKRAILVHDPSPPVPDIFPVDTAAMAAPTAFETNLQSPNVFRNHRGKRGRWRQLGMLNHSLSSPTDNVLQARESTTDPRLESAASHPSHRAHTDGIAGSGLGGLGSGGGIGLGIGIGTGLGAPGVHRGGSAGAGHDDNTVNRRPSLIRRLLSSGRLSLDRYEGRFSSFRGAVEEADEATATPRKTLSLFAKDGPLRRSFHRVGIGESSTANSASKNTVPPNNNNINNSNNNNNNNSSSNNIRAPGADSGINFVNSQSKRLPPKVARERQRMQRQAASSRKSLRGSHIFGSRKSIASSPSANVLSPQSTPVMPSTGVHQVHMMPGAGALVTAMPDVKQTAGTGYHSSPRLHTPTGTVANVLTGGVVGSGLRRTRARRTEARCSLGPEAAGVLARATGGSGTAGVRASTGRIVGMGLGTETSAGSMPPPGPRQARGVAAQGGASTGAWWQAANAGNNPTQVDRSHDADSSDGDDDDALRRTMSEEVTTGPLVDPTSKHRHSRRVPEMRVRPANATPQAVRS